MGIGFFLLSFLITVNPEPYLKFGYPGILLANILGAGTALAIPLTLHFNTLGLALVTATGMAINDSLSWLVGRSGEAVIHHSRQIEKMEAGIRKYGVFAIFFWALIPFPFEIIGVMAGYLELPYLSFLIPMFLGRFTRFFLLGLGMVSVFGAK